MLKLPSNFVYPIPESRRRNARGQFLGKFPFAKMEVGDYFIVNLNKNASDYRLKYNILRSSAYNFSKREIGRKFSCSSVPEGIKVVRI